MTFPIDLGRYEADYIAQPADLLALAGGLNTLHAQLDKDIVLLRRADGPIADGDLVGAGTAFGTVALADTAVGPIGVALNSAVDEGAVKVLSTGTRELSFATTHTPAPGDILYCTRARDAADGTRWAYGVGQDLPADSLLIGQVATPGAQADGIWTGVCDVRMGPGAVVTAQLNTGAALWTGNEIGVRAVLAGSADDLPEADRPEIRFLLPKAIPVNSVTFLGGDLWLRFKQNASDFSGIDAWKKMALNLDTALYKSSERWQAGNLNLGFPGSFTGITNYSTNAFFTGDTPATMGGLMTGSHRYALDISLTADATLNALRLRINGLHPDGGPAKTHRFAVGFQEFYVLCRNFVSDLESQAVNGA